MRSSKRGVALAPETLVKLLLLSAFLILFVVMVFSLKSGLSNDTVKKYSCWMSSSLASSNSFAKVFFPATCSARIIDDELDIKGVSNLLRETWWTYGLGEANFDIVSSMGHGEIFEAARFKVSEKVSMVELLKYMLVHRKGSPSSWENSDYNYLQKNAQGSTVCYDKEIFDEDNSLVPNHEYKLYFADSSILDLFKADKLLIMKELKDRSYWDSKNKFVCYNVLTEVLSSGEISSEANLLGGGWVED